MEYNNELQRRAKELNCLYNIDNIFKLTNINSSEKFERIVEILPFGFEHNDLCSAKIVIENESYCSKNHKETNWFLAKDIFTDNDILGTITVYYHKDFSEIDEGPFSTEERQLLNTVCDWISRELLFHKYEKVYQLVRQIRQNYKNTPVTATEPLFGYMANALGLDMKGLAFQWVIMNDSEPSPNMMKK